MHVRVCDLTDCFNLDRVTRTPAPWRNRGNVWIVGRDSESHLSWKFIGAVTLGRDRSPALCVGRDLHSYPTCRHTKRSSHQRRSHSSCPECAEGIHSVYPTLHDTPAQFTLMRDHSPALTVGRDLNQVIQTCGNTNEFTLGRDHSPASVCGRDSVSHPTCGTHQRVHYWGEAIQFSLCGKSFKNFSRICGYTHQVHTGERPFTCSHCVGGIYSVVPSAY